jgi:hypothetical protein
MAEMVILDRRWAMLRSDLHGRRENSVASGLCRASSFGSKSFSVVERVAQPASNGRLVVLALFAFRAREA